MPDGQATSLTSPRYCSGGRPAPRGQQQQQPQAPTPVPHGAETAHLGQTSVERLRGDHGPRRF